ncbi:MAG: monovalent cation/hydrogen antiporter, partial [Thermoleophilales bacterium]|nr:monovalent cation/hydrogen antiporter [Thermoleophilales bacterium]
VAPLLYVDGFFAPIRELRRNVVSIALLSSVLVVGTAGIVAVVAHEVVGLPWAVAFALGAALAATDALAPTQVLGQEGVEPRLLAVIQGESLFNDGVAITLVRVAGAAAVSGHFAAGSAAGKLALAVVGGIAAGIVVAWVLGRLRVLATDVLLEGGISLLTPFAAYIAAEAIHGSGILAAVAAGLYMGQRAHNEVAPLARVEIQAAWRIISFVLNSLLFLLVGLQAKQIFGAVDKPAVDLAIAGAVIVAAVIGTRLAWAMTIAPIWRSAASRVAQRVRPPSPRRWRLALGWSGVRGSVALAAALSIPTTTDAGSPVPGRDLAIVLTLIVIVATLVVQGLTLKPLVRRLGLSDPGGEQREEDRAVQAASDAALRLLDEVADRNGLDEVDKKWLAREHALRRKRAAANGNGSHAAEVLDAAARTDQELLDAARGAVLDLEDRGEVRSDVAQRVLRRLDLDSARQRE